MMIRTVTLQFSNKSKEEKPFAKIGIFLTSREGVEKDAKTTGLKHTW
jgi:hypothetical protein